MGEIIDFCAHRERKLIRDRWLSKQQLADYFGRSPRWVQYRVAEGMPHRRYGQRLQFSIPQVERWLDGQEESA